MEFHGGPAREAWLRITPQAWLDPSLSVSRKSRHATPRNTSQRPEAPQHSDSPGLELEPVVGIEPTTYGLRIQSSFRAISPIALNTRCPAVYWPYSAVSPPDTQPRIRSVFGLLLEELGGTHSPADDVHLQAVSSTLRTWVGYQVVRPVRVAIPRRLRQSAML